MQDTHYYVPKSRETEPYLPKAADRAFCISKKILKEETAFMKPSRDNRFATNKGGVIRAPKSVGSDSPKATVGKGNDPRSGKSGKK